MGAQVQPSHMPRLHMREERGVIAGWVHSARYDAVNRVCRSTDGEIQLPALMVWLEFDLVQQVEVAATKRVNADVNCLLAAFHAFQIAELL